MNTTELATIYDEFLKKGMKQLVDLQSKTQMENEHLANAGNSIIIGAMENTIKAIEVFKRNELLDKEKLLKDEQFISAQLQNGGIKYDYTYYTDADTEVSDGSKDVGDVKTKTLINGGGISIYELQQDKLRADIEFTDEQKKQLGHSVVYNNRIKALENYSDMIGNVGIGGFVISSSMWTTYFKMINDIYINSGDTPVNQNISVPPSATLTKA